MREAGAEIDAVLTHFPDLTYHGFLAPPVHETERSARLRRQQARTELMDAVVIRQFVLCQHFASRLGGEDPKGELASSGELKRDLERWYLLCGSNTYVSQGMMIIAMISSGFSPRAVTPPSCCFLLSRARLTAINRISTLPTGPARSMLAIR
jgi:hypothetical protein